MTTFYNIVKATGRNFEIEKTISGYYRLMLDGEPYHDDSACEDLNGSYDEAEAFYANMLLEYEVPEEKKEFRCGTWFLKKQPGIIEMQWRDDESYATFIKRVAERLNRRKENEYECRAVKYVGGSSISMFYRTGEAVQSKSYYVYEVDKEGNQIRVE